MGKKSKKKQKTPNGWTSGQKWGQLLMSKNYINVTFEAWPCELRNSLLMAMQCNICKYCIVVTVICVKYAWHKDGAVLNIDMIQQTYVCSTSKICWFFNDLIHGRERWVGSIWIVLNVNIKILKSPQITRCWQCWEWYILFNTLFSWGMGPAGDLYTTTIVSVLLISWKCRKRTNGQMDGQTDQQQYP